MAIDDHSRITFSGQMLTAVRPLPQKRLFAEHGMEYSMVSSRALGPVERLVGAAGQVPGGDIVGRRFRRPNFFEAVQLEMQPEKRSGGCAEAAPSSLSTSMSNVLRLKTPVKEPVMAARRRSISRTTMLPSSCSTLRSRSSSVRGTQSMTESVPMSGDPGICRGTPA